MVTPEHPALTYFKELDQQGEFGIEIRHATPIVDEQVLNQLKSQVQEVMRHYRPEVPVPLSFVLRILVTLNPSRHFFVSQIRDKLTQKMIESPHEDYFLNLDPASLQEVALMLYMLEPGMPEEQSFPHADPTRWFTMNMQGRFQRLFTDRLAGNDNFPLPFRDDPLREDEPEENSDKSTTS